MLLRKAGLLTVCATLILLATGCAAPPPVATPVPVSHSDAFAYCAAVTNIDAPDTRYAGPKVPDNVVDGLMKAMKMSADAPRAPFAERTVWRCMGGKVYGCNIGANIPCGEKANVDKTATGGMKEFCTANPTADVIPAAVTGRATVYSWRCTGGQPAIVKELTQPDARGFLSSFWYEVPGKQGGSPVSSR